MFYNPPPKFNSNKPRDLEELHGQLPSGLAQPSPASSLLYAQLIPPPYL